MSCLVPSKPWERRTTYAANNLPIFSSQTPSPVIHQHPSNPVHSTHAYLHMKMEQTERSETSAYKLQMPGNYPKESIQHLEDGESLKSRIYPSCDKPHTRSTTYSYIRGPTFIFVAHLTPKIKLITSFHNILIY
jgi:hypothetical protein